MGVFSYDYDWAKALNWLPQLPCQGYLTNTQACSLLQAFDANSFFYSKLRLKWKHLESAAWPIYFKHFETMQLLLHNFATSEVTAKATMLPARGLPNQLLIADSFCDSQSGQIMANRVWIELILKSSRVSLVNLTFRLPSQKFFVFDC